MFLAIMIDGGYLDSAKRKILGSDLRIQHDKLSEEILRNIQLRYGNSPITLIRVIYYDCYPYIDEAFTEEKTTKNIREKKDSFFNYIKSLPRWDIRTGTVRPEEIPLEVIITNYDELTIEEKEIVKRLSLKIKLKERHEAKIINYISSRETEITILKFRQKGTDIQLCTDMLTLAQRNGANLIIGLLSGDTDFIPVIEEAKKTGTQAVLIYFEGIRVNPELWRACDERVSITQEFLKNIVKMDLIG